MYTRITLLASLLALAASCKNIECGDGTAERDGTCVPANETVGTASCDLTTTVLNGTVCTAKVKRECDPDTTEEVVDVNNVHICVGTGATGCAAKLPCQAPTDGKQTICGQLYDFENNEPFANAGATGTQCVAGATTGPCALTIKAYDAVVFAMTGGGELTTDPVYIDDCGRYRLSEVAQPGPPGFIALGIDDTAPPAGPTGVTMAVGVTTTAAPNTATKDFEAFIVRTPTYQGWVGSGAPMPPAGLYAPVYRGHRTGTDLAANVAVTFAPMSMPTNMTTNKDRDFYFGASATARTTLDPAANATGVNGTALFSGATLAEVYSGTGGGIPSTCLWEVHAAQAIPGAIFIQIFRPMNFPGMTCPL